MTALDHLVRYARRVRDLRRAHAAVSEPALAPAFQEMMENLLALVAGGPGITVVPEYANPCLACQTIRGPWTSWRINWLTVDPSGR